ncbi:trafficking protein particle complex subunit 9, partial [Tremellales sp. Uapishka_1]
MASPTQLSALGDPLSLAKLQILLVPVHLSPSAPLQAPVYSYWTDLIERHAILRGDEIIPPPSSHSHSHSRRGDDPRRRFFPPSSGTSISRTTSFNHVHLAYPSRPPAKHLYPLSLLRLSGFPLVVIGIAVEAPSEPEAQGYEVDGEGEADIGASSSTKTLAPALAPSIAALEETLKNLLPDTSPFPLVKRLMVVPPETPRSPSPRNSPTKKGPAPPRLGDPGDNVRHAPSEGVESWISRLLGEVVGEVLGELGDLATALETPSGLQTLSSTLLPSLTSAVTPSNTLYSSPSGTPTHEQPSRSSNGTPTSAPSIMHSNSLPLPPNSSYSFLSRALTPGGRPTSVQPPALAPLQTHSVVSAPAPIAASSNPFRRSTAITSPFSRTASTASNLSSTSVNSQSGMTKYTSAPLAGIAGGRLLKLLGDFYLLAGMYGDAIKCFDEGAEKCRTVGDVLWEAGAREGRAVAGIGEAWEGRDGSSMSTPFPLSPIPVEILSHFLSALSSLSRSPLPYPPSILSPSPHAAQGSLSIPAPSSTSPSQVGTGEGLLAYLHTTLSLRISHFLLLIWASGGWGSIALSNLMAHTLPRSFPSLPSEPDLKDAEIRRQRSRTLRLHSARSQLQRHSVLSHAEIGLGPHHRSMSKTEQLAFHVEVVWLARYLGLERKEVGAGREVVKRVGGMIVEGREETKRLGGGGFTSRSSRAVSSGSGEKGESSAASSGGLGLGLGIAVPTQNVAVRRREAVEGNRGVMMIFERSCQIMGIDLIAFGGGALLPNEPEADERVGQGKRFGWPELQVDLMKEGIAVAEALPDHASIIRLCLSALQSLHPYLNGASQLHLSKMYPAAMATARRRGIDFGGLPWWLPGQVVLSLEVASLPPNKMPVEHSQAEIGPAKGKDPFLYNPRLKAAGYGKTVIVANEQVDVFVTVSNPFAFDLEIQDLSLLTSGVPFVSAPLPLVLPASSVQTVRLAGIASSPGSLQIKGVTFRLHDGSSTDILLPVIDEEHKVKQDKRRSRVSAEASKIKKQGLEARYERRGSAGVKNSGGERWLECKVVEEQPLLWIKKTNLTHGTVMLYNGETSTIRITLENSSAVPVDFVKLSFDDSTIREAQAVIQDGDLTPEQAYELEWDLLRRPVFSWEKPSGGEVSIQPGGRVTLSITCLGKVGCTDGSIRIDYGYLGRSSEAESSFHTRQITYPVLFSVYHTFECHSLDITRFVPRSKSGDARRVNGNGHGKERATMEETLDEEADDEHCLFGLSIRNVYGVPFEVTFTRQDDISTTRLVPPGATERLLLPLPRPFLSTEDISKPIPSLSDRQYVVEKLKKTSSEAFAAKSLFWYREELFKLVSATWREPGSQRFGSLNLRDQQLGPTLVENFKLDDVVVTLAVNDNKEISMLDFVPLTATITNRSEHPIQPRVRFEIIHVQTNAARPPAPPPKKTVLLDGLATETLSVIQPNQSVNHAISAIFLATGAFSFRVAVEEVVESEAPARVWTSSLSKVDILA